MSSNNPSAKEYWEKSDAQFAAGVSGTRKRQPSEKMKRMKSNSLPPNKKRQHFPSKMANSNNVAISKPTYADVVKGSPSPALITKAVNVLAPKLKLAQKTVQAVNDVNANNSTVKAAAPAPSAKMSKSTSTTVAAPVMSPKVATASTIFAAKVSAPDPSVNENDVASNSITSVHVPAPAPSTKSTSVISANAAAPGTSCSVVTTSTFAAEASASA